MAHENFNPYNGLTKNSTKGKKLLKVQILLPVYLRVQIAKLHH